MFFKYIYSDFLRLYSEFSFKNLIKCLLNPSFRACVLVRCAQRSPGFLFWFFRGILVSFSNIDFGKGCEIGEGLLIPHPIGIIFGGGCKIGNNFTIYQNVTLGNKKGKYPKIGNNVIIYCNSVVVGEISLQNDVVIGALSFVDMDLKIGAVFKSK